MANRYNLTVMKINMFITSYFPLYVIMLLMLREDYKVVFLKDKIDWPATITVMVLLLLSVISIFCTVDLFRTKGTELHTFLSPTPTGDDVLSYLMTYVVPLLSEGTLSYRWFVVNVTLFLLIGIMYVKLDLVYLNPLWLLLGYRTYTIDNGVLLISNVPYDILKQGELLKGTYLTAKVYLVRQKDI